MYMCVYIILLNVNLFILLQKEESVFFEKSQNYFKWFFFLNFMIKIFKYYNLFVIDKDILLY